MNIQPTLNLHTWISLPSDVRMKIRQEFEIPRSGNVVVFDGKVETDGTTHEDFKALSVEKMQKYTGSDTEDFYKLFDLVVKKITGFEEKIEVKEDIKNANTETNVKKKGKQK